jgi:hypothetical protein
MRILVLLAFLAMAVPMITTPTDASQGMARVE